MNQNPDQQDMVKIHVQAIYSLLSFTVQCTCEFGEADPCNPTKHPPGQASVGAHPVCSAILYMPPDAPYRPYMNAELEGKWANPRPNTVLPQVPFSYSLSYSRQVLGARHASLDGFVGLFQFRTFNATSGLLKKKKKVKKKSLSSSNEPGVLKSRHT